MERLVLGFVGFVWPGGPVAFDEVPLWRAYPGFVAAALFVVAMQAWLIVLLLVNRAQRRRAQRRLAEQLRFETLISDLLASQLTLSTAGMGSQVQHALALIGADLDTDRVLLAELETDRQGVAVTYTWTRAGIPPMPSAIERSTFPWIAAQIAAGHVVVMSPARPLPSGAEIDRQAMTTYATRSLLAMPLVLENAVIGVLTCATVRRDREWPEPLVERLRLLAEVFASMLGRHRAEAAARASEARFLRQREELIHALRVTTLGELGASLAHELNQPLSAILLNAGALRALLGRGEVATPDLTEALSDIAADAKRAGDIIGRLRALARKEHVFQRGLSLDALVDEVAGLLHQDFVRRGIVVQRTKAPRMPPVSGDPIQLQQIVLNLLVNASEALETTERGRREITIETLHPASRLVELAVRDSAVGAKDVDLERMFERFVTTKPGGLGMGLAISRSIAEAHGGRIYAKANSERGLTVYVELPAEV
jgi:C4-dicarboxylate-specific signal transduction histidine kinase